MAPLKNSSCSPKPAKSDITKAGSCTASELVLKGARNKFVLSQLLIDMKFLLGPNEVMKLLTLSNLCIRVGDTLIQEGWRGGGV